MTMNNGAAHGRESFIGLNSFDHISTSIGSAKSTLIKSSSVKEVGIAKIEIIDGNGVEPTIHVHKQGEEIVKIEFKCSCGRSTHLDIEHDVE
jgi:hypothetical protein